MNRLACFDTIRVANNDMNTKYFWIIFLNQIIFPSLLLCLSSPRKEGNTEMEGENRMKDIFNTVKYFGRLLYWRCSVFLLPDRRPHVQKSFLHHSMRSSSGLKPETLHSNITSLKSRTYWFRGFFSICWP